MMLGIVALFSGRCSVAVLLLLEMHMWSMRGGWGASFKLYSIQFGHFSFSFLAFILSLIVSFFGSNAII